MARPKPWLKLWNEWVHDPKFFSLSLAERGAWPLLLSLAQECAAGGHIIKGNGTPMTLQEMAEYLRIKEADYPAFESMVYKMSQGGSIRKNGDGSFFLIHFEERQSAAPVKERVRAYRERQKGVTETLQEERESSKEKKEIKNKEGEGEGEEKRYTSENSTLHSRYSNVSVTSSVFQAYEKNIEMLTPMIAEKINDAIEHYPGAWIIDAIGEAVKQNKRSWAYIEAILKRWESEGRGDGKVRQNAKGVPGNRPAGAFSDLTERDKEL